MLGKCEKCRDIVVFLHIVVQSGIIDVKINKNDINTGICTEVKLVANCALQMWAKR